MQNYLQLEEEHARVYMNEEFIKFLKQHKFDVGLGSIYLADSLLFRWLEI